MVALKLIEKNMAYHIQKDNGGLIVDYYVDIELNIIAVNRLNMLQSVKRLIQPKRMKCTSCNTVLRFPIKASKTLNIKCPKCELSFGYHLSIRSRN